MTTRTFCDACEKEIYYDNSPEKRYAIHIHFFNGDANIHLELCKTDFDKVKETIKAVKK